MKFSLVYPTRHRPQFIEMALKFLEHQRYDDFEVIVSDNYIDPSLSCENYCRDTAVRNVKYVRPPQPVGMVANWNFALQHATGDYICYFTDKMLLLPRTLSNAAKALSGNEVDIVNWIDNRFTAFQFPDYFGPGKYSVRSSGVTKGAKVECFDPREELNKKALAVVSRNEQDPSHYARGKVCFGAYSKKLIRRIVDRTGALFHNASPDYSSMILGCSYAQSAVELGEPGIVHVITDLSNGGQGAIKDQLSFAFIKDLESSDAFFEGMLIPNLYSCPHNCVSHDYLTLKRQYDLDFEFNRVNWLVYITEDLDPPGRIWSTPEIEREHRKLLKDFIDTELTESERAEYLRRVHERSKRDSAHCNQSAIKTALKTALKPFIPEFLLQIRRKLPWHQSNRLDAITDILSLR